MALTKEYQDLLDNLFAEIESMKLEDLKKFGQQAVRMGTQYSATSVPWETTNKAMGLKSKAISDVGFQQMQDVESRRRFDTDAATKMMMWNEEMKRRDEEIAMAKEEIKRREKEMKKAQSEWWKVPLGQLVGIGATAGISSLLAPAAAGTTAANTALRTGIQSVPSFFNQPTRTTPSLDYNNQLSAVDYGGYRTPMQDNSWMTPMPQSDFWGNYLVPQPTRYGRR